MGIAGSSGSAASSNDVNRLLANYDNLHARVNALESIHIHDALVSFLAGCVTLTVVLAAVRYVLISRRNRNPGSRGYTEFPRQERISLAPSSFNTPNTSHHLHAAGDVDIE